ncbi:hypothetical protein LguiB_034455 [Lonicera macranthoides]
MNKMEPPCEVLWRTGDDLCSVEDGSQLFKVFDDEVGFNMFFPKGMIHSVKPQGRIRDFFIRG